MAVRGWTRDEAILSDWLWHFYQVRHVRGGDKGDVAVLPDFGPRAGVMMRLLSSLGVGVHLPGPQGELLVEVHRPDGIVVGMPGPAVHREAVPLLRELYAERIGLSESSDTGERRDAIVLQAREIIRQALQEADGAWVENRLGSDSKLKGGAMPRNEMPLSELMDLAVDSDESYFEFLQEFRRSNLGVIAQGSPAGKAGPVQSTAENPISLGSTEDTEGRSVLLAFADPPAFAQRFGMQFNAAISGEALLQTALSSPSCHGIRVNSAKRELSLIIDRKTVQRLLRGGAAPAQGSRKPWWKFW